MGYTLGAMIDTCTKERRSEIMAKIRSKDTTPELLVRRLIYGMGYRYRLHVSRLPGKPDIVMHGRRKIIDVRGCFWHGHEDCVLGRRPKSRPEYWIPKIARNIERDKKNLAQLEQDGWRVMIVWECELKDLASLETRLHEFITS